MPEMPTKCGCSQMLHRYKAQYITLISAYLWAVKSFRFNVSYTSNG